MYQVLARKYRPKNFHQLLGQDHVAKALVNAINHQRLHHAYLFTGTRGVGKTTIARILAKCLNCETGVTSEPCGVCSTCVAIDAGRFIDLIEIDAASRTKVEDTRELLDNVPYAPTQGRYKVYLIDEVHMLSTHSFNALLKTLEEPPEHVKFLLATTDPQKLPITIISRCLQFVLRPLPQPQLAEYLGKILDQEHITYTTDALWQLASSARGSVRDALSLTDQAIAFGNGQISDDTLTQMLGLIDQADVVNLLTLIVQQRTSDFAFALQQLRQQVVDAKAVFDRLAEVLHQVALLQLLPNFDLQLQCQQQQALEQLAQNIPAELVQLYYEIVVKSRENISLANTPAQALEMCLLRMLAFKPLQPRQITPLSTKYPSEHPQTLTNDANSSPSETLKSLSHTAPIHSDSELDTVDNSPSNPLPLQEQYSSDISTYDEQLAPSDITFENTNSQPNEITTEVVDYSQTHTDNDSQANFDLNSQLIENSQPSSQPLTTDVHLENDNAPEQVVTDEIKNENFDTNLSEQQKNTGDGDSSSNILSYSNQPTEQNNSINTQSVLASPLTLLQPSPQSLEGEWTPQKWDYWVAHAREQGWLAEDTLAFAKIGVMTGQIGGESHFVTDEYTPTHHPTFTSLQEIVKRHLLDTKVTLEQVAADLPLLSNKPNLLQQQREIKTLAVVTEQISSQPVVQALISQSASISLVKVNSN